MGREGGRRQYITTGSGEDGHYEIKIKVAEGESGTSDPVNVGGLCCRSRNITHNTTTEMRDTPGALGARTHVTLLTNNIVSLCVKYCHI